MAKQIHRCTWSQFCVAKRIFATNDVKLHKNYKNCSWSLIFALCFLPTFSNEKNSADTIHISRTSLVRCLRKFLSHLPGVLSRQPMGYGPGPISICVYSDLLRPVSSGCWASVPKQLLGIPEFCNQWLPRISNTNHWLRSKANPSFPLWRTALSECILLRSAMDAQSLLTSEIPHWNWKWTLKHIFSPMPDSNSSTLPETNIAPENGWL